MLFRTFFFLCLFSFLFSCKKYKDPNPITDPRIKNHYCNDPSAVNFNWDFPGIADNTVCIYPSDIFEGNFKLYDTTINDLDSVLKTDSFNIEISKVDTTKLTLSGFCGTKIFTAKANRYMKFELDSIISFGQSFCNSTDTIIGNGYRKTFADTASFYFNYLLQTPTGIEKHKTFAIKK